MSILYTIFSWLLALVAGTVLLSYAFYWYESANQRPELLDERGRPGNLWLVLRLLLLETLTLALTLLLHPAGWIKPKERPLPKEAGVPVLLLHGLFHNPGCWLWTRFRLRRQGFKAVYTLHLPPWRDIELLTETLAKTIDQLRHLHGIDKVHLVGHSMGGIIARNYIQLRGGAGKVERCVLLGAPNAGSRLVPFALTRLARNLMPGGEFLQRLAAAPLPAEVRFTSIYSRHDNLVLPWENARLAGSRQIELGGIGHTGLLYSPRAFNALLEGLREDPRAAV